MPPIQPDLTYPVRLETVTGADPGFHRRGFDSRTAVGGPL